MPYFHPRARVVVYLWVEDGQECWSLDRTDYDKASRRGYPCSKAFYELTKAEE